MNNRNYILAFFTLTTLFASRYYSVYAKSSITEETQSPVNADSIELTTLVRNVYEWHETKFRNNFFLLKFRTPKDSIFTGVDWESYTNDMDVYQKTNFFSKDFFIQHRAIALRVDSSIKEASVKWRNINDGIPIWDTDADDWCGCQDSPDNYWKLITLNNFKYSNDVVSFYWTWGNKSGIEANKYEMKATKESGNWRISYIEGFTYYGTVAGYNKTMAAY